MLKFIHSVLRYNQQKDHPGLFFELVHIGDSKVTVVHKPILAPELKAEVPFEELSKRKISKAKMSQMPPANQAKSILPQAVLFCKEEFAKMQATLALHADMKANQVSHSQVAFAKNPPGLFTLEAIKIAKGLKLIAMGTLAKPKGDLPKGAIAITWQTHPWKQFHDWEKQPQPQECLVPFWWRKAAEEDYNMELGTVPLQTMGLAFEVPRLTDMDKIEANQLLAFQKPKAEKEAAEEQESQPSQPAKKREKT